MSATTMYEPAPVCCACEAATTPKALPSTTSSTTSSAGERVALQAAMIAMEFKLLQESSKTIVRDNTSALIPANYMKNRYYNILPDEHTRVKLTPIKGMGFGDSFLPGSDYINANYITGKDGGRIFISSQAPLRSTFVDFWRMVWEQQSSVIMMLTKLVEKGQAKAEVYWPETQGQTNCYGNLSVTLESTSTLPNITVRHFTVCCYEGEEESYRNIVQLHYTEWPDFGLPSSTSSFRQLLKLMEFYHEQGGRAAPIVAHCSAGVGRTGTLIAISALKDKFYASRKLERADVHDVVRTMREQRAGMVQTEDQYRFIYWFIEELLDETPRHPYPSPSRSTHCLHCWLEVADDTVPASSIDGLGLV